MNNAVKKIAPRAMPLPEDAHWLCGVALFADLVDRPGALEILATMMERRSYPIGSHLVQEGEVGTEAYFLTSGVTKIVKAIEGGDTFPVAMIDAAAHPCLGEAALIAADKRSATIVAETAVETLILDRQHFEQFTREHPQLALPVVMRIARTVVERLNKTNGDLILLYKALVATVRD